MTYDSIPPGLRQGPTLYLWPDGRFRETRPPSTSKDDGVFVVTGITKANITIDDPSPPKRKKK